MRNALIIGVVSFLVVLALAFTFDNILFSNSKIGDSSNVRVLLGDSAKTSLVSALLTDPNPNFEQQGASCVVPSTPCGPANMMQKECTSSAGGSCSCRCTNGGPGNTPVWSCHNCGTRGCNTNTGLCYPLPTVSEDR